MFMLVGCFGLNGPLRQYFSLNRRERERKKREMIDKIKNVQTTPTRTHYKRSRPLPYYHPNKYDAPALEVYPAPLHHPTTPKKCSPPAPTASAVGPCPTLLQISRTPRHWKLTQHHRTTRLSPHPNALKIQSQVVCL